MELKQPYSMTEQVSRLKAHGLRINDFASAEKLLSQLNYYRFTGYALRFRKDPSDSDYSENTNFDMVYRIYQFDEELRNLLRKYLEKVEIYYRTQISYWFSLQKCMKPPHDQHYDENNFYNKKGFNNVMDSFKREKNYYRDSLIVMHHQKKYSGQMPLWVIVELISFSNISKLYNSMYYSEQKIIADSVNIGTRTLSNHLHCLSVLRNKCAHAARLYDTEFNPPVILSAAFLRKNPGIKNNSLFAYVIMLTKRLPEEMDKSSLSADLKQLIKKYDNDIDLKHIGFPINYSEFLNNKE